MAILRINKVEGWGRGKVDQILQVEGRIKAKAQELVNIIFARLVGGLKYLDFV